MKKLIIAFLCLSMGVLAQQKVKVLKVIDGDTFVGVALKSKDTAVYRCAFYDSPEMKSSVRSLQQPYADEASAEAKKVLTGKTVKVYNTSNDIYGRVVGRVKVDGYYIDRYMISSGFAWAYDTTKVKSIQMKLEVKARKSKVGLWQLPNPVHPSEWRSLYSTRKN